MISESQRVVMRKINDNVELSEHDLLFHWLNFSYSSWILNLESLRPLLKRFKYRYDAVTFNNGEHFEELRQSTMLEF